jgi:hypothetical protein
MRVRPVELNRLCIEAILILLLHGDNYVPVLIEADDVDAEVRFARCQVKLVEIGRPAVSVHLFELDVCGKETEVVFAVTPERIAGEDIIGAAYV